MTGARVVDARAFAVDAAGFAGPMLIAQCDTRFVLLRREARAARGAAARARGHRAAAPRPARRARRSRSRSPSSTATSSPTTSPRCSSTPATSRSAAELARLLALTERLRGPGGCPWDAAQTHHSLRRHVLEEAYEVVEAIDELPADAPGGDIPIGAYDALEDELGDLLFQVMIQSVLAAEAGAFTVADVARGVHAKLVRRHPHVFGDVEADDARRGRHELGADQEGREGARRRSSRASRPACPSLLYAQKLFRKAASVGLEPERRRDASAVADEQALGDALAALAVAGRRGPASTASRRSRAWAGRFRDRFVRMEAARRRRRRRPRGRRRRDVRALWDERWLVGRSTAGRRAERAFAATAERANVLHSQHGPQEFT